MNTQHPQNALNDAIGNILRYGVILSSAVLAVGLVLMLFASPPGTPGTLQGTIAANFGGPTLSPSGLLAGIGHASAVSILQSAP